MDQAPCGSVELGRCKISIPNKTTSARENGVFGSVRSIAERTHS